MNLDEFYLSEGAQHRYVYVTIEEFIESLKEGKLTGREISDRVKDNFYSSCRIAPGTSRYMRENYPDLLNEMSFQIAKRENVTRLQFLADETTVIDLLPNPDAPVIHTVFLKTVVRDLEDYFDIIDVVGDKVSPNVMYVVALQKNPTSDTFRLGYLVSNDEVYGASARLVVLYNGVLVTIPAKHGTYSSGRYLKSTDSASQALEMMLLRMKEESNGDRFSDTIGLCHMVFSDDTKITCEEYSKIMNNLVVSLSSDGMSDVDLSEFSIVEQMINKYGSDVEMMMTKYLWRCTAVSDNTLTDLLENISSVLSEVTKDIYVDPSFMIELGNIIFSERLLKEIASLKG